MGIKNVDFDRAIDTVLHDSVVSENENIGHELLSVIYSAKEDSDKLLNSKVLFTSSFRLNGKYVSYEQLGLLVEDDLINLGNNSADPDSFFELLTSRGITKGGYIAVKYANDDLELVYTKNTEDINSKYVELETVIYADIPYEDLTDEQRVLIIQAVNANYVYLTSPSVLESDYYSIIEDIELQLK